MRFSPDGSKFITVSSDKKGVIYDGKTGEKMGVLSAEDGHCGSVYAVSWSPDGKQVNPAFSANFDRLNRTMLLVVLKPNVVI